ncbi:small subunit processome component 20 homolog [Physella acuta]|uniref:small subunit processome component 20 homolog n=1 Tax=Physella acuta TaxID=109671 RepID=UPI0027DCEBF3|nr:small subunit processome component 20 homolog [Physella acuta]
MGKSSKHKTQNIHHFVPFSERISSVNVDVIHRIRRIDDETEGTLFGECLTKWTELDLTDNFSCFRREIVGQVQTYEQLVHHKEEIINSIKKHLEVPNSLALNALLDLLVQLARDLQQDFVPHFYEFFTILVRLLSSRSQDVESLEQIFQALAFLFRVLWRFLIKDFKDVYRHFSRLLMNSQKDYIKVFASESCAYLLRKVKKQDELLNFLFGSLNESPELVDGIGLLLFEMVKGVKHHFHTISKSVFPLILQKLGTWSPTAQKKLKLPRDLVEQSVTIFMQGCADHTTRENCKELWEMLLDCIQQVHAACLAKETAVTAADSKELSGLVNHLCRLLRLLSVWLTHNSGSIVNDAELVAKTVCQVLKSPCKLEDCGSDLLKTVADLVTSCQERLPVEIIFRIISNVFKAPFIFSDIKIFVKTLRDVSFFEKDVLPGFMLKIHSEMQAHQSEKKDEILACVTELLMYKTQAPITGDDLHMLTVYPLDQQWSRSENEHALIKYIDGILHECVNQMIPSDLPRTWSAILCLPHIKCPGLIEKAILLWSKVTAQISSENSPDEVNSNLIVLNQLVRSFITSIQGKRMEEFPVSKEDIFYVFRLHPTSPCVVQILDFYLTWSADRLQLDQEMLTEIYKLIEPSLVSPSHNVRLMACHILSLFQVTLPEFDDDIKRDNAFHTMYVAERLPLPTVHNYREKLIYLRKLEYEMAIKCLPNEHFYRAPLLFLLGNEFWNFKLLWAPLSDLIASYAVGLDTNEFWEVMLQQLRRAAFEAEKELRFDEQLTVSENRPHVEALFGTYCSGFLADSRKPDFTNYRVQLWKTMKLFPEKCVLKSDELCELYLKFLKNEFSYADEDARSYQNILARDCVELQVDTAVVNDTDDIEIKEVEDDEKIEEEDEDDEGNDVSISVDSSHAGNKQFVVKRRKAAVLSLLVHLDVFALFKKQRSMFNQPEVQETFLELLKHRFPNIQKAAFECVMTYKSPHVIPYRENFNRLLDDKTFKSEITLFRVDEESSEVKDTDREGLLPVLMRILYGKMHGKAGNDTAGKSKSNLRRSIVFGFLIGCKPAELKYFLELLFQPCMHFVTDNPVLMVKTAASNIDLKKMLPLKKIKGILNTVSAVSQKMGHRMESFSHSLFHVLLGLVATLSAALDQRSSVVSGAVNLLKSLRHTVMNRIIQFFENFEDLDFTTQEIEAVFHAVVWPQCQKLALEGVHHPTPLLKLFTFWSQSSRFQPLLAFAKHDTPSTTTALHSVFALLNAPAIHTSVSTSILELVGHLLQDEEEKQQLLPSLPEPFMCLEVTEDQKLGEILLLPHVPSLLSYLKHALRKMSLGQSVKKPTCLLELKILARVSTFVTSPEECSILCDLLVPFFSKGSHIAQDIEENILVSLTNLMQYINKPESFYRTISQLFSTVERRESRVLLCKLFKVICENNDTFKATANLIEKLNSWDKRKAEEPDYLARLEAFSQFNSLVSGQTEPNVDALLPVVHNCCHFIHAIDDLSIRDNSTHCLVSIIAKLATSATTESNKAFNIVVEKTLLPQVKLGIRSKSEAVRHEFLAVFQSLVVNCPDHVMFTGLKDLCDKDPEADFFENIRHIQMHKRSRALRRLFKHLKDHQFRPEIHMSYFIPLVHAFVLDNSYSKYANVQDAAIDLLGAICKQLPWPYYLQLLRFFLKLLPKKVELQRQIVRILVALLDAFHFDLSNSTFRVVMVPKVVENSYKEETEEPSVPDEIQPVSETEPMEIENKEEEKDEELAIPMEIDVRDEEGKDEEAGKIGDTVLCSVSAATRIHKTIVVSLLPQLHKIVTQKAKSEDEHKTVKSKYPEDEEILRVPIALAMIKLLQNLPKGTLENRLPGILLKICNFLRCRSRDVRTTARETLEKAALSLGARFFPFIVKEMKAILTRGYQLHILSYTTHYLLKSLVQTVNPGDLDPALSHVQDVFFAELFGHVAEEKEVAAIRAKYFEAKFIKGYDAYELLAKCISAGYLNQLIQPIKGVLETTHSQHTANKAETVLRKIADGLMANSRIPLQNMMVFINNMTAKLMPELVEMTKPKVEQSKETSRIPESCLLLPAAMPRGGVKPKASKKTNIHILVEFGLQLLNMCLKKSLLLPTELLHLQMLDPLVVALRDCLSNSHVKTSAHAMRCLSWILKFPLPSLKENIHKIAQGMFIVLQNYTGAATSKGGNQELITMCFKAVTVLVRDVEYYQLTTDQLQVLLTYCEEDLYNYLRQSSAFNLVRAILLRKLDIPQLHQVMEKLFEMSITASAANVRLQCRQVILHYLMNYPLGKKMRQHLYFFINHLEYEMEDGRESALEMMISMFTTFPKKILHNHSSKFFAALAMASYNDNSPKCRKLVSLAIRTLIGKVDLKCRKIMFAEVINWIKNENPSVQAMGFQVCGMFVEVEGGKFEYSLGQVIPLLQEYMDPTKYSEDEMEDPKVTEKKDVCLLAVLNTSLKIARELSIVRQEKFIVHLNQIWSHVLSHLLHPHIQVRLASSQLLGFMFSAWEPSEIVEQQSHIAGDKEVPFLLKETAVVVRKFSVALCNQLKTPKLDENIATQAIKNLLYLARVMEALNRPDEIVWLAKKIMREANMEVINHVKITTKRNHTFKWVAAVGITLKPENVTAVLPIVLPVLQRELSEHSKDVELKNLAQEVVDILKKQVDVETFTKVFASCLKYRLEKKDDRKRKIAAEAVTNPEIAARKKIRHNLKKRETKKKKIAEKPGKRISKSKLSILNIKVDDD